MKQNRKLLLLLLILSMCICNNPHKVAKAAQDNTVSILSYSNIDKDTPLAANTTIDGNFIITSNAIITFKIYTTYKTDMNMQITNSKGQIVCNPIYYHTDNNWQPATVNEKIKYYRTFSLLSPNPDTYTFSVTFSNDTYYIINGTQSYASATENTPTLNTTDLVLAKGMSQKISVLNNSKKVTWSSMNKSVATVNKKGMVKAKKIGKTTIKAKIAGDKTLICSITVVKNQYQGEKENTLLNVPRDKAKLNIYKISYDKKGNIVMKAQFLNRYDYRIRCVKNLKIKLRTQKGKLIGTYSAKKAKNVKVKANSIKKTCTFKIKKRKLKIKMADLRKIQTPQIDGRAGF